MRQESPPRSLAFIPELSRGVVSYDLHIRKDLSGSSVESGL